LQQSSSQPYWLATIFELQLSTTAALELLAEQDGVLKELKPSKMNRLQRSLISTRVSSVASDSTVGAANFLSNTIAILRKYSSHQVEVDDWKVS
jgi:midasin